MVLLRHQGGDVAGLVADLVLREDEALEVLRDAALGSRSAFMSTPANFVSGYFFAIVWIADSHQEADADDEVRLVLVDACL